MGLLRISGARRTSDSSGPAWGWLFQYPRPLGDRPRERQRENDGQTLNLFRDLKKNQAPAKLFVSPLAVDAAMKSGGTYVCGSSFATAGILFTQTLSIIIGTVSEPHDQAGPRFTTSGFCEAMIVQEPPNNRSEENAFNSNESI